MTVESSNPAPRRARCEVFVLGGGPAGSTAAALLAERGRDVVIVEKERHPRFHIGESLLPLNLPLFEKLGVAKRVRAISMPKYGAEFTSPHHDSSVTFEFANAWDKAYGLAYQVRRSEFDQILFENCVEKGARAHQECQVTDVDIKEDCVHILARGSDGTQYEWEAQYLVDASGRQTFLASKFGIKQRNRNHSSAALFGHFTGAERLPGKQEGNISVFWFEHGWFWFIPLLDGTTSVGAVCNPVYLKSRRADPATFLLETIALCPALAHRLRDAKLTNDVTATGNYSYTSERMVGERYILLGDAYAFVDPVFSSGVMLAMNSAFHGAEVVDTWLDDPDRAQPLMRQFDRTVRHGVNQFSWFIYRMTSPAIRKLFMQPSNPLRMQEALLSLLAGDLFRGTPIHWSLRAFKGLYYVTSLFNLRSCLAAWRRRKEAIRDIQTESASGSQA